MRFKQLKHTEFEKMPTFIYLEIIPYFSLTYRTSGRKEMRSYKFILIRVLAKYKIIYDEKIFLHIYQIYFFY